MAEKKTTHVKKDDTDVSLTGLLMDSVIRGVQSFIDGALESVRQMVQTFTGRVARQVLLLCFAFVGMVFLLVGFSQLLSAAYHIPGLGAVIIGVFVLVIVLTMYIFDRNKQ